jgi:hypothetical protein
VLSVAEKERKIEDNMVPKGSLNTGNLGTVSYLETEKSFGLRTDDVSCMYAQSIEGHHKFSVLLPY